MQKSLKIFAERFRVVRGSEAQGTFAKRIGIGQVSVSQYERGDREPSLSTLQQIAIATNTSTDYLLGLTDDPTPPARGTVPDTAAKDAALSSLRDEVAALARRIDEIASRRKNGNGE